MSTWVPIDRKFLSVPAVSQETVAMFFLAGLYQEACGANYFLCFFHKFHYYLVP